MKKISKKKSLLVGVVCVCVLGTSLFIPGLWSSSAAEVSADQQLQKESAQEVVAGDTVKEQKVKVTKNETVYTKLASTGAIKDTTVVNWYHFADIVPDSFIDPAKLKNVKALNGSFEVKSTEDGVFLSGIDKSKKDLYYSGETDQVLPVDINIHYYLDGEELPAEEMIGRSGALEIRISLQNLLPATTQAGAMNKVYMPLIAMISMDLPVDTYSNVEVGDGMVTVVGETMKANWMSFPYPDSEVRLTSDVHDFKLDSVSIIIQPQMPPLPQIEMEDKLVTMSDGINQLDAALAEIEAGSEALVSGQGQLTQGLSKTEEGVDQLLLLNQIEQKIFNGALLINDSLLENLQAYKSNPMVKPVIEALSTQKGLLRTALQGGEAEGHAVPAMSVGNDGLLQTREALEQMEMGAKHTEEGARQLQEGVSRVRLQGIDAIQQGLDTSLQEVRDGEQQIKLMEEKVDQYDSFMDKPEGTRAKVQFVIQTVTLQ